LQKNKTDREVSNRNPYKEAYEQRPRLYSSDSMKARCAAVLLTCIVITTATPVAEDSGEGM